MFQFGHALTPVVPAFSTNALANVCVRHESFLQHMSLLSLFPSACPPHILSAKMGPEGPFSVVLSKQAHPASCGARLLYKTQLPHTTSPLTILVLFTKKGNPFCFFTKLIQLCLLKENCNTKEKPPPP